MEYLVVAVLALPVAWLLLSLVRGGSLWNSFVPHSEQSSEQMNAGALKICPLCGHSLRKGERIKSVVFKGGVEAGGVKEQVSHLFGCPYCWPPSGKVTRFCPVCKGSLGPDGYLICRYFTRKGRSKQHLHVLGCTDCRRNRKK